MAADGTDQQLFAPFDYGATGSSNAPEWSPDGQTVAFHRDVGGTLQVFVLDVRTRAVRQLTSVGRNEDPTWAPDSRHMAFVSDRSGYRQLWIIDVETGRILPLLLKSSARRRAADSLAALGKSTEAVRTLLATMIHFDYDKAIIRGGDAAVLDQKVAILQANPGLRIRISGHCDERGSDEYNLALGNRRATAAKQYLVSHGIDAGRIETVSYGEERPIAQGHDETAWAQNRRDEFEILSGGDALRQP